MGLIYVTTSMKLVETNRGVDPKNPKSVRRYLTGSSACALTEMTLSEVVCKMFLVVEHDEPAAKETSASALSSAYALLYSGRWTTPFIKSVLAYWSAVVGPGASARTDKLSEFLPFPDSWEGIPGWEFRLLAPRPISNFPFGIGVVPDDIEDATLRKAVLDNGFYRPTIIEINFSTSMVAHRLPEHNLFRDC